jgi:type VI secretion system Hcp family effector
MKIKILVLSSLPRRLLIISIALGIILTTAVISGESQCFLNIQGLRGNATEKFHKGWIKVLNYRHSISGLPAPSLLARQAPVRNYARAGAGEFALTKTTDPSTPTLSRMYTKRALIPKIKIEQRWVSKDKVVYMAYVFSNVTIVDVKPSGSGPGDADFEEVNFNYGTVEWEYTETKHAAGKPKGNVETEWDVEKSEEC